MEKILVRLQDAAVLALEGDMAIRPRFRLRTVLALMAVLAVLTAWYADRARLTHENERLARQNREMKKMIIAQQYSLSIRAQTQRMRGVPTK